jgi:hypothetical protein
MHYSVRRRLAGLVLGSTLALGACAHSHHSSDAAGDVEGLNIPPTDYKSEILGAMHAYLNDPTGIRNAGIAEPAIKTVSGGKRYVVCLQFNAKDKGNHYAGLRDVAAVFVAGRFDHFVDPAKDACTGATYTPFPELEKLPR